MYLFYECVGLKDLGKLIRTLRQLIGAPINLELQQIMLTNFKGPKEKAINIIIIVKQYIYWKRREQENITIMVF